MIKQEISEIKRQFTPNHCSISRICGCYVDGEKNKKTRFGQAFLSLPEEEIFKYFEILKKSLSGSLGRNLVNLDFPLDAEMGDGPQTLLLALRDSGLKDEELLDAFYDRIIETYDYVGNYLILIIHDAYDVPGKSSDGLEMDDASDEVYEYILTSVCPVNLSKPGLSYNAEENAFQNRIRDWVVSPPETAFLFPAFNDRSSDLHSTLYYSKNPELRKDAFVEQLLGCSLPLSAASQRETFQTLLTQTLQEDCDIETIKTIHENLAQLAEEHKDDPLPLSMEKKEVKSLLAKSGVSDEKLEEFEDRYEETAGADTSLLVANVTNARSFEVRTPDISVKASPDKAGLIETRTIDGRSCLLIPLSGRVEVNGIPVRLFDEVAPDGE